MAAIAAMGEEEFVALCSGPPAIHRFPGSMAKRVHQACQVLVRDYGGRRRQRLAGPASGAALKKALTELPGFGPDKAAIFTAVLGKRRGITPDGWREAAGGYGEEGVFRSVADIVDADSLQRVRATKQQVKAAKRAGRRARMSSGTGRRPGRVSADVGRFGGVADITYWSGSGWPATAWCTW